MPPRVSRIPETRYARNGDVHIAWQAFGQGPPDIVFVAGFVSHVESQWDFPSLATFMQRLARLGRVIVFDKRGTGMSDRVATPATLEQRIDDLRAVMDAAGSQRAVLFGTSEGVPASFFFAATWPQRTLGLVAYGGSVVGLRTSDYPWAPTYEERERFAQFAQTYWSAPFMSTGQDGDTSDPGQYLRALIAALAPSAQHDPAFAAGLADYLRRSASPGAVAALARMNAHTDVRAVLGSVAVPTLVLHRVDDLVSHIDEGRYIAQHIPGACLVELAGNDHFPSAGDTDALMHEIEVFVAGLSEATTPAMAPLVTCVQARWAARRRQLPPLGEWMIGDGLAQESGKLVFDGPVRALHYACKLRDRAVAEGLPLALGVALRQSAGGAPATPSSAAEMLAAQATAGEVLVAAVVRDLVAGSGLVFADRPASGAAAFALESPAAAQGVAPHPARASAVLSPRQVQVLRLVAEGRSNREIAAFLHRSEHTVHRHLQNILNQLSVSSRAAAVAEAAHAGLL